MTANRSQTLQTACILDCPDACSLDVTVADGRLVRLEGSERNPLTQGFICSKVRRFDRHVYGEERLEYPARRVGPKGSGSFERIRWDEALDEISTRWRQLIGAYGGESILPLSYGGSNGMLSQDTTDARLFRRLGASRLARTVCAAPSGRAANLLYGKMPGVALTDYVHARLIVVWGANPSASGIHLVPIIQQAQKQGARLVVIDPRRIPLAKKADLHLALKPGTDLVVALALIRWLFAQGHADLEFLQEHATGVAALRERAEPWTLERAAEVAEIPVESLEALARLYAESDPAVIRCGWGPERNRNGGSAIASILALPAVAGKFGPRGGGFTMSNSAFFKFDTGPLVRAEEPATRKINMNQAGARLLDAEPPIRSLFVYNCNPLMTLPCQEKLRAGLEREDLFTIVFEQVMTDTARYADILLPATSFLEHQDIGRGYGALVLQKLEPVIDPVGEARSNLEVFAELCDRLGVADSEDIGPAAYAEAILARSGHGEALRQNGTVTPSGDQPPVPFTDHFPRTPDGKIHLLPEALDAEAPEGLYAYQNDPATADYPLALISPATSKTVSSTLGQLLEGQVPVDIHPQDAAARRIETGDRVRIFNSLGEVRCRARISQDVRPGVAMLPKGLWGRHTENGCTSNALCPDTLTDIGEGATFNDARVNIERLD